MGLSHVSFAACDQRLVLRCGRSVQKPPFSTSWNSALSRSVSSTRVPRRARRPRPSHAARVEQALDQVDVVFAEARDLGSGALGEAQQRAVRSRRALVQQEGRELRDRAPGRPVARGRPPARAKAETQQAVPAGDHLVVEAGLGALARARGMSLSAASSTVRSSSPTSRRLAPALASDAERTGRSAGCCARCARGVVDSSWKFPRSSNAEEREPEARSPRLLRATALQLLRRSTCRSGPLRPRCRRRGWRRSRRPRCFISRSSHSKRRSTTRR